MDGRTDYNHFFMVNGKNKIRLHLDSVFLDRDGTIIEDRSYLGDPEGVRLLPGAVEGLARFSDEGLRLFVVTNQSGIGRGYFRREDYLACRERISSILNTYDIRITDEAYCPHAPEDGCACRKPNLGQWRQLAEAHGLAPERCLIIGDKVSDLEFGYKAGFALCSLVLTGEGAKTAAGLGLAARALNRCRKAGVALAADGQGRRVLLANDLNSVADWVLPRLARRAA